MTFSIFHYMRDNHQPQLMATQQLNQQQSDNLLALVVGKLSVLAEQDNAIVNQIIHEQNTLLLTRDINPKQLSTHLNLSPDTTIAALTSVSDRILIELKQIVEQGNLKPDDIQELLIGQQSHLQGKVNDWVYQSVGLTALAGQPAEVNDLPNIDESMSKLSHMIFDHSQHPTTDISDIEIQQTPASNAFKFYLPAVAALVLWFLYQLFMCICPRCFG